MAQRFDRSTYTKTKRLDNGWLRVDGLLTRTGVFPYRMPDGSIRRELRSDAEVFNADSLASFEQVPVTDGHPPVLLDSKTTREYTRGSVSGVSRSDNHMKAKLLITDEDLIKKIEAGVIQVSNGYNCDIDLTSGVTATGERYDAIQRNIRGNHVAIVPSGRAGPTASLRLDEAEEMEAHTDTALDAETQTRATAKTKGSEKVKTIRIDGVDYEVASDQTVQAFERLEKVRNDALVAAEKKVAAKVAELETTIAKLDSAIEAAKKKDEEIAAMPAKIAAQVKARASLESVASKVLGEGVKLDGDDRSVMVSVIKKINPKFDDTNRSNEYIAARFDSDMEKFTVNVIDIRSSAPETKVDALASYESMKNENAQAWKQMLKKHNL